MSLNPFQLLHDTAKSGYVFATQMMESNNPDPGKITKWDAYRVLRDGYADQMNKIKLISEEEGFKIKES